MNNLIIKKDDHNLLIAPTKMNIEAAKDLLEKQYHIKMTKKLTGLSHTIFYNVYELELLPWMELIWNYL